MKTSLIWIMRGIFAASVCVFAICGLLFVLAFANWLMLYIMGGIDLMKGWSPLNASKVMIVCVAINLASMLILQKLGYNPK